MYEKQWKRCARLMNANTSILGAGRTSRSIRCLRCSSDFYQEMNKNIEVLLYCLRLRVHSTRRRPNSKMLEHFHLMLSYETVTQMGVEVVCLQLRCSWGVRLPVNKTKYSSNFYFTHFGWIWTKMLAGLYCVFSAFGTSCERTQNILHAARTQ